MLKLICPLYVLYGLEKTHLGNHKITIKSSKPKLKKKTITITLGTYCYLNMFSTFVFWVKFVCFEKLNQSLRK